MGDISIAPCRRHPLMSVQVSRFLQVALPGIFCGPAT